MTKKILFLLTFLLVTTGGSKLWAEGTTHKLSLNGSAQESTNGGDYGDLSDLSFFQVYNSDNKELSYSTKFKDASYDGIDFTSGLKMGANTIISFETTSISTVTIVQSNWQGKENNIEVYGTPQPIKFDGSARAVPSVTNGYCEYTISNVAAGVHSIIRGGGESGIFYVKVVEASTNTVTLTSSHGTDLTNGGMVIAGTQKNFTVTVGATHNASNATVSYSGSKYNVSISAGVLTISAREGQTYGTETITVTVPEEGDYLAGSATLNVTYWTGDISNEYSAANVGRKWTFNHAWTNSGLFYDNVLTCGWTQNGNHFEYQRTDISINAETAQVCDTYVEQMYGLKVKQDAAGKVWMQSTEGIYYLAIQYGGTIVIPHVPSGKTVRVNAFSHNGGKMFINSQENTVAKDVASDFTYITSSTGDVEITTSSGETIYFNSIVIEGSSTGDETVRSAPYTWNFENGSTTWGNTAHQVSNVYSDWNYGGDTYYNTNTGSGEKGYVIDAIKGLRFENIPYLGLDWGYGHLWMDEDAAKITIPNLKANQVVTFVMEGREGEVATGTSSSVIATNTDKSSSISILRTDGEWTEYDFKVISDGSATFTFKNAVSIRKIIIRKVAPTLVWTENSSETLTTDPITYGQGTTVTHTATASVTDGGTVPAVNYRSGNTEIATVDNTGKVTPRRAGTVDIYAYTEAGDYATKEISYSLTINKGTADFTFVPQKGKVGVGKWIIPRLSFPSIAASAVTTLKVSMVEILDGNNNVTATYDEDSKIASYFTGSHGFTIENYADLKNSWETNSETPIGVHKVNVKFTGVTVGTKARVTVSFESNSFEDATATYTVEVTDALTRNFSWADGTNPEYYTYAGDFMMLPALTGNSNGNYNYSSGAKNSSDYTEGGNNHSALHAYEYDRKWDNNNQNFKIKWNNNNIKIGEGFPDFAIETEGISSPGTASVFFGKGEGGIHPDTLMVYCEKAGDVKLRAYDPQDHTIYCDATIHILPISDIEGPTGSATTVNNGMTYPYTWDFTTDFDMTKMVGTTDQYWIPMKDKNGNLTGDYTNGYGFFNIDWADTNKNPDKVDRFYKYFIAGASGSKTGYMPQFNGMMLQMKGQTSWANKIDRMRILAYDKDNKKGRLEFIGGYHTMKLFLPEVGKRPTDFKIFVKASGTGHVCIMGTDEKVVPGTEKTLSSGAAIYSFDFSDVTSASDGYILMGFDDAHVYWIAMSTEAKSIGTAAGGSDHMASYSYSQTMDYSKSYEANGVDAYVATAVTNESSASNPALKVTLQKSNTSVPSGTGVVLKATDEKNAYMIADARNVDSYKDPDAPTGNLLIGTGKTGCTIYELAGNETGTTSGSSYVPFYLSSKFRDYSVGSGIGEQQNAGYYAYWRVYGTQSMPANYSYMVLDADTYKDTYGKPANINGGASSRILLAFDESDDDSGTTGIENVRDSVMDSDAWYTLQGVKVNAPAKGGIYIHKGKKVVVK